MKALITGGAGYIGSTIASYMVDNGHTPVLLDSLVKGREEFTGGRIFYKGDIGNTELLMRIVSEHPDIACTVHCAALIVVPESVSDPYLYYRENVAKPLEMMKALVDLGSKDFIFSSSASIYQPEGDFQVDESSPTGAKSPYGYTKIALEHVFEDFCRAYGMRCISLRYFNPIGGDPNYRSGPYDPNPSHLLGNLVEVAGGRKPTMEINGVDWPTRDGTAIRDYIHIWDLARAHTLALERFENVMADEPSGYSVINLGSEKGVTVKEFVNAFEEVAGKTLKKVETPPRPGDAVGAYASSARAKELLRWKPELSIQEGIRDALAWDEKRKGMLGY
jgi:UDP-glucose 4-epimerase